MQFEKPKIRYSEFIAYRRLQQKAADNHFALYGVEPTGEDLLEGVEVVPDVHTKSVTSTPMDALAEQVFAAVKTYIDRRLAART